MMGDILKTGQDSVELSVDVTGTGAVECIDVFNGCGVVETLRPTAVPRESPRIKIVWAGAEVRGRARKSDWDGSLVVNGNAIADVTAINFWNPDQQIRRVDGNRLEWESITTGGTTGLILTLEDGNSGDLALRTTQRDLEVAMADVTGTPTVWDCGGLEKRIQMNRLPEDASRTSRTKIDVPLGSGTNPLYVRVTQEDGHMAWSSPIYVERG